MNILIPLPAYGFDPTETAIPWKLLSADGHCIVFATPDGRMPRADIRMLNGENLGPLGLFLRARNDAVVAYREMEKSELFLRPITYAQIQERDFDALILPGGHDKGVKEYLESLVLQRMVVDFFVAQKPVGAICHGVVLVARSINPKTGKSILYDFKTTALLTSQERGAYFITKCWLGDYYLTYPSLTVEDEVTIALSTKSNFVKGGSLFFRDSFEHSARGFVVRDRNYISARWPGDAYRFSLEFMKILALPQRSFL